MSSQLGPLLTPNAIAVMGASRDAKKWGQRVIRYSRESGFQGEIFAVNPHAEPGSIPGARVIASINAAPASVDCAFLALPRHAVEAAVEECCAAGVSTIVIAASGFGESSADGVKLERKLMALAGPAGARIVGPNCFGVSSSVGRLNLTPFPHVPAGRVALASQSGNVAAQLFIAAERAGIGFSHCVGVGNQLDVGFGDLLSEFAQDLDTDAIALYVEGVPADGGGRFMAGLERCREAGKLVVVIKAGASQLGAAVAETHTRSLAADDGVWDMVLQRGAAIRVASIGDMIDVLRCGTKLPRIGARVAVVTDGGGDSVLALDALALSPRLRLAQFTDSTVDVLASIVPPAAPRVPGLNPLTLDTAGGVEDDPQVLARCVAAVAAGGSADVVYVGGLFGTYTDQRAKEMLAAEEMLATAAAHGLALIFQAPITPAESEPLALLARSGIPFFESANQALKTLNCLVPESAEGVPVPASAPAGDRAPLENRLWPADNAMDLLSRHGVNTPVVEIASGLPSLLAAATRIGYPVCLKTADPQVLHKSDVGGVHLGLADEDELRRAAALLQSADPSSPLLIMPSFPPAFEFLVGGYSDPYFGPVVMVGRGGVLAELEADTALVVAPITTEAVRDAIGRLRCFPILQGYRGSATLALASLCEVAVGLGRALEAEPRVAIDLNPVLVYPHRCEIADVRVLATTAP